MIKDPLIGRLVDSRYEVLDRVARGGMATVYRAHDRRLDRVVALKLMHPHLADSPDFVARFRREARAAARLSNPGVVAVYDQGSIDGVAYLVMELVEGRNLRDLIVTESLSVGDALRLTAQVLRPLGAAHRAGMVHRDVKPENVLLPADGSVAKVADFGLARAVTEATQTTTGNILGTVAYLSPELLTKGETTPRADVYAVGILFYELLTGEQPFTGDSPVEIAVHNVHNDVPAPSRLIPDLPPEIDDLVAAMTQRDPDKRPADADAALNLLREAQRPLSRSQLAVRRDGNEASTSVLEPAPNLVSPEEDGEPTDTLATTPNAGMRTVSLPIGAVGPNGGDGSGRQAPRSAADDQPTTALARSRSMPAVPRRALIGAGILALTAVGGSGVWYFLAGPGNRVEVPQIEGMTSDEAQAAVKAADLEWAPPTEAHSDTIAPGSVISADPAPGSRVDRGATVTAVISLGVEQKTVPDVVGSKEDDARLKIQQAGLNVGAVTRTYSDSVEAGLVLSTDPKAGEVVNHSSAVAMVVSKGREPATVPNVTGKTEAEATTALKEKGLAVGTVTEEFSDTVASGTVISQDPAANATGYFKGDAVNLVISKGPETVTIPDVSSMNKDEAKAALEALGLVVQVSNVLGGLFGTVRSTDPPAGTKVKVGSTVTLTVL
ncbi:Stk1 family PASTA domain-containing Ser/Thr kinase [Actinomyces oricola]